jgi:hypothetical protein
MGWFWVLLVVSAVMVLVEKASVPNPSCLCVCTEYVRFTSLGWCLAQVNPGAWWFVRRVTRRLDASRKVDAAGSCGSANYASDWPMAG